MQGWLFLDRNFWQLPQAKALVTSVPQVMKIVKYIQSQYTNSLHITRFSTQNLHL